MWLSAHSPLHPCLDGIGIAFFGGNLVLLDLFKASVSNIRVVQGVGLVWWVFRVVFGWFVFAFWWLLLTVSCCWSLVVVEDLWF